MNVQMIMALCILVFMVVMLLTHVLPYGVTAMICCVDDRTDDCSCKRTRKDEFDSPVKRGDGKTSGKERSASDPWYVWNDDCSVSADGTGRMYFRYASVYPDL